MTNEGEQGATVPEDVAQLEAEFPEWRFRVKWAAANSGSDGRMLHARCPCGCGVTLAAATADGLRRKIRGAQR